MRFLILAASLALLTTPTVWGTEIVPDLSHSRLFGPNAYVHTLDTSTTPAPTSSPDWTTGYGLTSFNVITAKSNTPLPLPPHTLQNFTPLPGNKIQVDPLPVGERYSTAQVFGPHGTVLFATIPLSADNKRTIYSAPYNNTEFTSISQFPKVGAGLLPSIDIFDDEFFGIMRLNGPNPTVIRKITSISPKFGPIDALRNKYPQLDGMVKAGKIYELDYFQLADVVGTPLAAPNSGILAYPEHGNPGPQQRYLAAPYVLLQHVTERGCSKIVPIAIQLNQTYVAGSTAVLYRVDYKDKHGVALPLVDQGDWNYAKTIVNAADAVVHQLDAHLTKTHFVMENVIIGTHVILPENHVISRLLIGAGHSLKTLQINEDGRNSMIPGIVDDLFAGGYGGAGKLVDMLYATYNWTADYVPRDVSSRGFDAFGRDDGTDRYYYAQDAIHSWNTLSKFVGTVLQAQYPNDQAVVADTDLQAWAAYLSTPQTGLISPPVPGFPSSFTTQEALQDAVTHALYKSTVGHSVVNYPQPFYNAYIPIYPALALYQPILNASQVGTGLTTDAYIASALGNANTQTVMAYTAYGLGQPIATCGMPEDLTLLQYATSAAAAQASAGDDVGCAIQTGASQLLTDLQALQTSIEQRDRDNVNSPHYQYGYFDPSRVANAIYA